MNAEKREKFIKTVIWVIVVAFVTTIFATWGAHYSSQQGKNDPIAIKIDGIEITKAEYDKAYSSRMEQLRKAYDEEIPDTVILELRKNIADELMKRALLKKMAEKYGINSTEKEIQNGAMRNFVNDKNQFDQQAFEYYRTNQSAQWWQRIEEAAAEESIMNKAYLMFSDKVKVTEQEVKDYFLASSIKAKIAHIYFTPTDFVSDADAEKFYNENRDSYFIKPEKRFVRHIIVSDTEMNDDTIGAATKVKINNIYDRLKNGGSFEQLVNEFSDEPYYLKSAKEIFKNGELGYITKDDAEADDIISDKLIEVVFSLKEFEISEPFKTSKGWQIAQVTDIKDTEYYTFSEKKKSIKNKLTTDTEINKTLELANGVHTEIAENKITFEQAIKKYSKSEAVDTDKGIIILPRVEVKLTKTSTDTALDLIKQIPLDYSDRTLYIAREFSDSVFSQPINQLCRPIKSKMGIQNAVHLIKVLEIIPPDNKDFKEEYNSTLLSLMRMKSRSVIDEWFRLEKERLEKKNKIEYRFSEPEFLTKVSKTDQYE